MSTSKEDIRGWLNEGIRQNASHVVVWVDRFDYEDYPSYIKSQNDLMYALEKDGKNMQGIMEIYNLNLPIEEQINQHRSWNI